MACPCNGGAVIGPSHEMDCPVGLDMALHSAMRREEAVHGLNRRVGICLRLEVDGRCSSTSPLSTGNPFHPLPPTAQDFIDRFDNGERVAPFSFTIDIPEGG